MLDWMGRDIHYLRVSLTERCNLKCIYCREESAFCQAKKELTPAELEKLMYSFAALGITRVRLTGGEPLVRRDLEEIVSMIASFPEIRDLSLTTNAQGLAERAEALQRCGLKRINVSIDSLDAERYRRMTRGGELHRVLDGVRVALACGLQVKLNAVLVKGENETEVDDFIALARDNPLDVRFIELMPFSALGRGDDHRVHNRDILAAHPELKPIEQRYPSQPSEDYVADGFVGRVGFISPISHKFCAECNRVRLTSDGKLRMCLGNNAETEIRSWLKLEQEELTAQMREVIFRKPKAHTFETDYSAVRAMNQIGG